MAVNAWHWVRGVLHTKQQAVVHHWFGKTLCSL
jgi:hypothetical protein